METDTESNELNISQVPICLSGGAEGADLQFGMNAGKKGHKVIHWSFPGHNSKAPESELHRLPEKTLEKAIPLLELANVTLQRKIPSKKYSRYLLCRNYYQVIYSESLYAVSEIDFMSGIVKGGTGWAVEMAKILRGQKQMSIMVYCQKEEKWFSWQGTDWKHSVPFSCPSGIYAGVGSRQLEETGKNAIRQIYQLPEYPTNRQLYLGS